LVGARVLAGRSLGRHRLLLAGHVDAADGYGRVERVYLAVPVVGRVGLVEAAPGAGPTTTRARSGA
jgi:hypothetical protein